MTPFKAGPLNEQEANLLNELDRRLRVVENIQPRAPVVLNRTGTGIVIGVDGDAPLLCEVTGDDGLTPPAHTVKRKTRQSDDTVIDYVPTTQFTDVLNPAETAWPAGTLVFVTRIPDQGGYRWGWPVIDTESSVTWTADTIDGDTCLVTTTTYTLTLSGGKLTLVAS